MQEDAQPIAAPKVSFSLKLQKKEVVAVKRTTQFASGAVEEAEDEERRRAEKRAVVYLENGEIRGRDEPLGKKGKREYVIPMKQAQCDWRIERLKKIVEEGGASDEDKARLALLLEAIGGGGGGDGGEKQPAGQVIPATISREQEDVDADYEQVPIGEFGLAFLRGCGWREEEGIGKKNRQVVAMRVSKPRPVRLGLGAERKQKQDPSQEKPLKPGVLVEFLSGPDRKRLGVVKSMDEDNASCYVELDRSGGKVVVVSQHLLEVKSAGNGAARQRK